AIEGAKVTDRGADVRIVDIAVDDVGDDAVRVIEAAALIGEAMEHLVRNGERPLVPVDRDRGRRPSDVDRGKLAVVAPALGSRRVLRGKERLPFSEAQAGATRLRLEPFHDFANLAQRS